MIGTMGTVPFDFAQSHLIEVLGFAASGATLCAFAQKQMLPMRISAIAANLFFIGYGALGLLYPVLLLHLMLLPLNVLRLIQLLGQKHEARTTGSEHFTQPLASSEPQKINSPPPFRGGHWPVRGGSLSSQLSISGYIGSAPP